MICNAYIGEAVDVLWFKVSKAALISSKTTRVPNLYRVGSILLVRLVIVVSRNLSGQKAL